ncbi:zinc-binding dehydrogenase [Streptomyces thinghirensis]|nr:zinc-binding dehydrogenase [Streptomyces thinghirensis]
MAALAEPAAVAWHAVAQAGDLRGKRILVVGSGPIGALAVAVAKRAGAQEVVAVDLHPRPREIASTVGATRTLAANDTDAVDAVGADVVIESSGNHRGLASAIRGATRGGTVVMVGLLPNGDQPVPIAHAITRELRLVGSFRFNDEIDEVIAALAAAADTNFRDDLTPLQACANRTPWAPPARCTTRSCSPLPAHGARREPQGPPGLTAGRFARSVERLTTYTEAVEDGAPRRPAPLARRRAALRPGGEEDGLLSSHAAQTEQRQVYRQAVAAAERVYQAWRQRGSGPAVPDITTTERPEQAQAAELHARTAELVFGIFAPGAPTPRPRPAPGG